MFCPKCGTQLPDNSVACSSCGTTFAGAAGAAPRTMVAGAGVDRMKAASSDAFGAFKIFAMDPVGGLSRAFDTLGQAKALGVGIIFGVVFALCIFLSMWRMLGGSVPFGIFVKILLGALVPFGSLFVASLVVRMVTGGEGNAGADSFIAGASLLPIGFWALIAALLGIEHYNILGFLYIFAGTLMVLMLFAGITRIHKSSERAATIAIPVMLVIMAFLSYTIYKSLLGDMMPGLGGFGGGGYQGMPPGFGE